MWEHHTDEKHGWKYSVTSNRFVVQMTGGSITISDRQAETLLRRHKGHHYLYTGDIHPDETQCFALENGKHFYVYSLENYELMKRVTLPRGYECIDMYGHYSSDGTCICIPAHKWIGKEAISEGYYEYVMFRYDTEQFTLIDKNILEDPAPHWWTVDDSLPTLDDGDMKQLNRIMDIVTAHSENKDFMDAMLGQKPADDHPAAAEIMSLIFEEQDTE